MQFPPLKVMAVDDDIINLEILQKNLEDAGYKYIGFEDGDVAWQYLQAHPEEVDIILLDKMMPRMNGMEVLKRMKADAILQHVPVILQTGDVGIQETKEGLAAGAYYYLEKPFDPNIMIALINAAARDQANYKIVKQSLREEKTIAILLQSGRFLFKTIDEARRLASALSGYSPNPNEISIALSEIMINAVEHGNLGISYDEKNRLLSLGEFESEIEKRLNLPENKNKTVKLSYARLTDKVNITISDEGKGFDWNKYLEFDPMRLTDLNGRGIATAGIMGLQVSYTNGGTTADCSYPVSTQYRRPAS